MRISIDAKATVAIGPYSRQGQSRIEVVAADHDFGPEVKVTPFGIFLPDSNQLYLYFTQGPVTSDFIVDCLVDFWTANQAKYPEVLTLLINVDNGPECHSRRTQFIQRITAFSDQFHIEVSLAYYPPYHSKYNPVERAFGVLERHWNGAILDRVSTAINFAKTMTYNHVCPIVKWVKRIYQTGVKLTAKQMEALETRLIRHADLPKWFVRIPPISV